MQNQTKPEEDSLFLATSTSFAEPYVFSSTVCREAHFRAPLYQYWTQRLAEAPRFHRKQWEFVYISHALYERGMLKEGNSGLGFGVGKEPLVSLFASRGVNILATDLEVEQAARLGWVGTEQRSLDLSDLNSRGLCEHAKFSSLVRFRDVDMNDIPKDIGLYDFIWSSCAFEHLGSIKAGLEFVKKSSRLLRPGGIAIHTTEFNVLSNDDTLDNHPSFVIFRRKDFEQLKRELSDQGNYMEDVDYHIGDDTVERYVDLPPYKQEPHLRLKLAEKYVSTSVGIIIHAAS